MRKPFNTIKFNLNQADRTAEIFIYGIIGQDMGLDAKQWVDNFQALEASADRINVRINSPGGSVWDGLPIFNAICASQKDVHTYNDGIAFSMSGMIGLAGRTVHSAQAALWMLHNVSSGEFGNAQNFRKIADQMDMYDALFVDLIATRTGKTSDFVKANWLNYEDNYFSPEDAKEAGLIDVIESYPAKNVPSNIRALNRHQIAAFYQAQEEEPSQSFFEKVIYSVKNTLNKKEPEMNKFPKLMALKGIKATDLIPEMLDAIKTEIAEAEIEGISVILDTELAAMKQQINDLTSSKNILVGENESLRIQLNSVSVSPTTPVAPADVIHESKPAALNFETSFDREAKKSFGQ